MVNHTTEQEDQEFPEELNQIINQFFSIDSEVTETRRIYLNNDWQITDSIGNPDFVGHIENTSNMDLTSLINYLFNLKIVKLELTSLNSLKNLILATTCQNS